MFCFYIKLVQLFPVVLYMTPGRGIREMVPFCTVVVPEASVRKRASAQSLQ